MKNPIPLCLVFVSLAPLASAQSVIELRDGTRLSCDAVAALRNYSYCVNRRGAERRLVDHAEIWKVAPDETRARREPESAPAAVSRPRTSPSLAIGSR